jgi:membrane protein
MADIDLRPEGEEAAPRQRTAILSWFRPLSVVLQDATWGLFRHDGAMVASAIAFSLTFAIFPFAILMVALGAVFGGTDLATYITNEALTVLPAHVIKTLEPELLRIFAAHDQSRPLTFGLLVTIVSVTGAVEAIRDGLNRAYGCTEDRHMVRRYLSSVFFVFVGTIFLVIAAALGIAVPIVVGIVDRYVPGPPLDFGRIETLREFALVVVTLGMLFAFHLFLPAKRRSLGSVVGGLFLTLVGWWLAGKVFGLYITKIANYTATYAGLAGFVILMFFLYIQALIFLYGAEVNRSIADFRGEAGHQSGTREQRSLAR